MIAIKMDQCVTNKFSGFSVLDIYASGCWVVKYDNLSAQSGVRLRQCLIRKLKQVRTESNVFTVFKVNTIEHSTYYEILFLYFPTER